MGAPTPPPPPVPSKSCGLQGDKAGPAGVPSRTSNAVQTCNGKRPSSPARAPAGRGSQSPVPLAYLDGQTRIAAQLDRQAVH